MEEEKFAIACKEVVEILKNVIDEDYKKIPKDVIEIFETEANNDYEFNYDTRKTLDEQDVSEEGKTIIALLFRDYWATEEQKEKIIQYEKNYELKLEEEKREKYNPDNLFKKEEKIINDTIKKEENILPEIVKETSLIEKIKNAIKTFFAKIL